MRPWFPPSWTPVVCTSHQAGDWALNQWWFWPLLFLASVGAGAIAIPLGRLAYRKVLVVTEQDDVAATPQASGSGTADVIALTVALNSARGLMATNARDWGMDRGDAWLYGLFCGWDCEEKFEDPEHDCADPDDTCEGQAAMREVARRWMWTRDDVARLRRYRTAIRQAQHPAEGKERSDP